MRLYPALQRSKSTDYLAYGLRRQRRSSVLTLVKYIGIQMRGRSYMQIRALGLVKVRLGHLLRCRVGLVRCDHLWLNEMGMTKTVLLF